MKLLLSVISLFALSEAMYRPMPGQQSNTAYYYPEMPVPQQLSRMQQSETIWDYRVSQRIGVASLHSGQVVEAVYVTPTSGRVSVNLITANKGIILQADARIDISSYRDLFLLQTYTELTNWANIVNVYGYPFTRHSIQTTVTLRITVQDNNFLINVNGIDLGEPYGFHDGMRPADVTAVEIGVTDAGAAGQGSIEKLSISFN